MSPTQTRSRDLAMSGMITVTLIVGVAYFGRHPGPIIKIPLVKVPTEIFTLPQKDPDPVEYNDDASREKLEPSPPVIADLPRPVAPDWKSQVIEPPPVEIDRTMTTIPLSGGKQGMPHIFKPSDLDEPPAARVQTKPYYPSSLRSAGITGSVLVDFVVGPHGEVRNARAVHSSMQEFEKPACEAVTKWRFRPGRVAGRAVFTHMQVPIEFRITSDE